MKKIILASVFYFISAFVFVGLYMSEYIGANAPQASSTPFGMVVGLLLFLASLVAGIVFTILGLKEK